MGDRGLSFGYTRHGGRYWSLAGVLLGLVLVEGALFGGLSLLLIRDPLTRWCAAGAALTVLIGVPLGVLLAPLVTRHRLTADELVLRYGWHRLAVPRRLIRAATPAAEEMTPIQVLRARHDAARGRAIACFSEQGQILLALGEPLAFPGRRHPPVDRILFNVDDRDALLEALGAPARAATDDPSVIAPGG